MDWYGYTYLTHEAVWMEFLLQLSLQVLPFDTVVATLAHRVVQLVVMPATVGMII